MAETTRFVVDAMLGSLARKLRIFGYDVLYFREGPDRELERIAAAEGRLIVTSDRALAAHASRHGIVAFAVEGHSDRARLESLVAEATDASVVLRAGGPRCAECNSALETLKREDARGLVPESVAGRHRLYYRCPLCDRLYWRGGHWSRLGKLSALMSHRK